MVGVSSGPTKVAPAPTAVPSFPLVSPRFSSFLVVPAKVPRPKLDRLQYYWPSMVTDIYNTITKCTTCAQNRLSLRRHTPPLTRLPATEQLTDLSVDIFGPMPTTKAGNRFILFISDRFSKLNK